MRSKKIAGGGIVAFLEHGHAGVLQKTDELYSLLTNLRYEGRASFGRNLKGAEEVLTFFNNEMTQHLAIEEAIIFPYIETHVPRLEPVIHFLRSEHRDLQRNLQSFQFELKEFGDKGDEAEKARIIEKIREIGTYLIYLLRNHIQEENESVYRALVQELNPSEKRELEKLCLKNGGLS